MSSSKALVRVSFLIAAMSVAGSIVAFVNQLVLARYFGAGIDLDAFLVAISLPLTFTGVLVGALNFQLIPALASHRADENQAFAGSLLIVIGSLGFIFSGLGMLLGPSYVHFIKSDNSEHTRTVLILASRIGWFGILPSMLSAYFTARHQLAGNFVRAAIAAPVPALCSTLFCIFLHDRYGILSFPGGQIFGLWLQTLILGFCIPTLFDDVQKGFAGFASGWSVVRRMPITVLALLLFSVYPAVDAFWASRLGESTMSYLGYGQRLVVGISAVIVAGASTVVFPKLSVHAAKSEHAEFKESLGSSLRSLIIVVCPIALFVAILALPAVRLAFERGAFGFEDSIRLAKLLPGMLVGLIAMCCVGVQYKALFARHDLAGAALYSVLGAAIYFLVAGLCSQIFGLVGFGYAYAITWWITFGLVHLRLSRGTDWRSKAVMTYTARLIGALAVSGAIAWAGHCWIQSGLSVSKPTLAGQLVGMTLVASLVYLMIGYGLRIPEFVILRRMYSRFRSSP